MLLGPGHGVGHTAPPAPARGSTSAAALRAPWPSSWSRSLRPPSSCALTPACSLFNAPADSPDAPLLIYLPPGPADDEAPAPGLPVFLQGLAAAVINYRWQPGARPVGRHGAAVPLHWPTPAHDTAFAYAWLVERLAPPSNRRRDIYVCGCHLGAGLAASLALAETHAHARFAVRGFVAYNGIYNWTMFLPDHRANRRTTAAAVDDGSRLHRLHEQMPGLFEDPASLFDPFASPSLFFHSPGLHVPPSFYMSVEDAAAIDALTRGGDEASAQALGKAPRKSRLIYPPRKSTLKMPDTLLLYDSHPQPAPALTKAGRVRKRQARPPGNTFEAQAEELAEMMRRSIDMELKERSMWDEDVEERQREKHSRVQVACVGREAATADMGSAGQQAVTSWLKHRM